MNITRKEFIKGLTDSLEGQGLTVNLDLTSKLMDYIESYMVPTAIPVKVGVRNGVDVVHNINKFRTVHKKCED